MKDGTIEIDGKTYRPSKAEYGRCCEVCDIGQIYCSMVCQRFEENENECVAMKLTEKFRQDADKT